MHNFVKNTETYLWHNRAYCSCRLDTTTTTCKEGRPAVQRRLVDRQGRGEGDRRRHRQRRRGRRRCVLRFHPTTTTRSCGEAKAVLGAAVPLGGGEGGLAGAGGRRRRRLGLGVVGGVDPYNVSFVRHFPTQGRANVTKSKEGVCICSTQRLAPPYDLVLRNEKAGCRPWTRTEN